MTKDEQYMHRCIELAQKGAGTVAPNPMVGAVLVHADQIIGEGWHQQYGEAHAEVNCINSVNEENKQLIPASTLYVSLEPCAHFGKTPPCSDLIIKHQIKKVVIGCRDPFREVNARLNDEVGQGKGIEKLSAAGVETLVDVLKEQCVELNKRFFTFQTQQRPLILLKWAQTADGFMGTGNKERLLISNETTNRLVHQWRSEEDAVLVGTNTALLDDPQLTNRYWPGKQPLRLVIDRQLRLPTTLQLFNISAKTVVFNTIKDAEEGNIRFYKINSEENIVHQITEALYRLQIQSVLVEGGAQLLQSFIQENLWDEVRIITNEQLNVQNGLASPVLTNYIQTHTQQIGSDWIVFGKNSNHHS
ncbi:MAG: bifunctional diaminohydroxyphosphoribosylaminopyrimidine deaminase/5-amino-6-(5-phosphoribosylamino)uracil reductase RibD [Chitinophagaceae bacterium]|nr:bifunctional diaminohydroxyphosphoribosylaminopyrimidine deaminase/5-amino-6-(5-phosphoribosylamino)uracil reductase RibD [Chitinophagaceae bacterium]